jgi:cell wall-associated NlpC family hydrolase
MLALALALALPVLLSPSQAIGAPTADGAVAPTPQSSTTSTTLTPGTQKLILYGDALSRVDDLTGQAAAVQAEIDLLDDELELRTESYNELVVKLDRTNVALTELRRELALAEANHQRHVEMLDERIRAVYKSGGNDRLLPMLFLADGMEDLYNRILLIAQLADNDAELVQDLKESRAQLGSVLAQIDAQKRDELSLRRQMADGRESIQASLLERRAVLAGIDTEIQSVLEEERLRQAEEQERARQAVLSLANSGQSYQGALPQSDDPVLGQLLETAFTYMGIPYVWAGDRPSTGFDCSGFTQYVFAQHGVQLPHYSGYQAQMGMPVNLPDIQTGDLLAFGFPVHHVGIYVGEGMFIHAPRTGDVIKLSRLSERTNLADIRRFPLQPRAGAPAVR